jgi:hypothetical protein
MPLSHEPATSAIQHRLSLQLLLRNSFMSPPVGFLRNLCLPFSSHWFSVRRLPLSLGPLEGGYLRQPSRCLQSLFGCA